MRLSKYFLPVLKENPAEAKIISHRLMLRAGMIRQVSAGIYNMLPLALEVMNNINNIIRDELNKIGALEILMPTIQPAHLWKESGRYNDYGKEMLKIKDRHDNEMLYGPTHEEVVTDIFRQNFTGYKDLPKNLYQIQWKFRDEIRPRFGLMRGREFCMKDAYSFDIDENTSKETYFKMYETYLKIFKRLGLTAIPLRADNGAIGGNLSHEFQIIAETGESKLYYDAAFEDLMQQEHIDFEKLQNLYAAVDERHDPENCKVKPENLRVKRGIEVGHIFNFGTKYSSVMNAGINNAEGKKVNVHMGSYGIGVTRLIAAIIEASNDANGIIWPLAVAPFKVGLINLKPGDELCDKLCEEIYHKILAANVKILYDDTANSAGKKFATMDLIGLPYQIIIGPKGAKENKAEYKERKIGGTKCELEISQLITKVLQAVK